jgi:hypothetical protein
LQSPRMGVTAQQHRASIGMFLPKEGRRKTRRREEREAVRDNQPSMRLREEEKLNDEWKRTRLDVTKFSFLLFIDYVVFAMWLGFLTAGMGLVATTIAKSGEVPSGCSAGCSGGLLLRAEGSTEARRCKDFKANNFNNKKLQTAVRNMLQLN